MWFHPRGRGTVSGAIVTQRTRGSERRERILAAAAELIAERGYHAVSMTDLGVAAGIVGPGIYRHFDSKAAVLASLFERVIDALLERASTIVDQARDEREALTGLVADHVSLVINDRELAIVYYRELHNLSDEQRRRLRRKQRLYPRNGCTWSRSCGRSLMRPTSARSYMVRSARSSRSFTTATPACPRAGRCPSGRHGLRGARHSSQRRPAQDCER